MRTQHRRAAHAKHSTRVNLLAHEELIQQHTEPPTEKAMDIVATLNACFKHLSTGGTDCAKFDTLAAAINIGLIRAESIDPMAVQTFKLAVDAMIACDGRYGKHRRYGFSGHELLDMQAAIDLYAQILALSTPAQMNVALLESADRMIKQAQAEGAAA